MNRVQVGKWNVEVLDLSKNRRTLDPTVVLKFWQLLDAHTKLKMPHLHRAA